MSPWLLAACSVLRRVLFASLLASWPLLSPPPLSGCRPALLAFLLACLVALAPSAFLFAGACRAPSCLLACLVPHSSRSLSDCRGFMPVLGSGLGGWVSNLFTSSLMPGTFIRETFVKKSGFGQLPPGTFAKLCRLLSTRNFCKKIRAAFFPVA